MGIRPAPCLRRISSGNQAELHRRSRGLSGHVSAFAQEKTPRFKVIAFYNGKADALTLAS